MDRFTCPACSEPGLEPLRAIWSPEPHQEWFLYRAKSSNPWALNCPVWSPKWNTTKNCTHRWWHVASAIVGVLKSTEKGQGYFSWVKNPEHRKWSCIPGRVKAAVCLCEKGREMLSLPPMQDDNEVKNNCKYRVGRSEFKCKPSWISGCCEMLTTDHLPTPQDARDPKQAKALHTRIIIFPFLGKPCAFVPLKMCLIKKKNLTLQDENIPMTSLLPSLVKLAWVPSGSHTENLFGPK